MKRLKRTLIFILVLALAFGTVSASAASATATTLRLAGYSGSVTVKNASGKSQSVKTDMRLYSGYSVSTGKSSAAYISLDGSKAVKLDSSSKVTVKKSGSKLEVCLDSGKLFFNVTAPLASNESLNIRTSTMVTGIRGSYGWVSDYEVGLLHGHVTLTCINPVTSETRVTELYSGDRVYYDPSSTVSADPNLKEIDFIKEKITNKDIPAFVVEELRKNVSLQDPIIRDVPTVDVPKLLGDYDSIKAAEEERIAVLEQKISEALEKQQEVISQSQADYLFEDTSDYTPTSNTYSVTLPTVQGLTIQTSDPLTDIEPGTEFTFAISPDVLEGYVLYEEYLKVTAGSADVTLEDDSDGGFIVTFTVNRNTNVSVTGAVHQVETFDDAVSAFSAGDTYVELLRDDTTTDGYTIEEDNTLIINTDAFVTLGDELTNNGTLVVDGGFGQSAGTYDNYGTTIVNGTFDVWGPVNNYTPNGTIVVNVNMEINNGGELNNNQTMDIGSDGIVDIVDGTMRNYGTITNKNSITVGADGEFYNYSNNTVINQGSIEIAGTFENGDGADHPGRFVNEGVVELTDAGAFNNKSNGTFENKAGATFTYDDGGYLYDAQNTNDGSFTNSGTMRLYKFSNNGSFINNSSLVSSNFTNGSGGTVNNNGDFTANSSSSNEGTFNNNAGGTFTNTYTVNNTGTFSNYGTFDNTSGAFYNGLDSYQGIVNNSGEIQMNSTSMGAIYNAIGQFNNNNDGTITGSGAIYNYATFTNNGSISVRDFQNNGDGTFSGNDYNIVTIHSFVFDLQMHSPDNYIVFSNQSVAHGQCAREPSETPNDVGGFHFEGWYQESACTNEYDFNTPVMSDTTVFAKWVED